MLVLASVLAMAIVPDASLRAVVDRLVRLEFDGVLDVEGRVLAFDEASVTVARSVTNEVITVPREHLERVVLIVPTAPTPPPPPPMPSRRIRDKVRIVGIELGLPGVLVVDADYGVFHAFASANLALPILTASGNDVWIAGAFGAGLSIPIGRSHWSVDFFAQTTPFHVTSFYTYLGFGLGAGFHYTATSGLVLGVSIPVIGFAARLGKSPYGYDASFDYNDSLGYYYLGAFAGMPLLTAGYRF